jgi:H+/gluconate symporter-like permease
MAGQVMNLFVIVAFGVILADLVANSGGTNVLFSGMANLWQIGVNGMLGKSSPGKSS